MRIADLISLITRIFVVFDNHDHLSLILGAYIPKADQTPPAMHDPNLMPMFADAICIYTPVPTSHNINNIRLPSPFPSLPQHHQVLQSLLQPSGPAQLQAL